MEATGAIRLTQGKAGELNKPRPFISMMHMQNTEPPAPQWRVIRTDKEPCEWEYIYNPETRQHEAQRVSHSSKTLEN